MKCHECALHGDAEDAVGICADCGRAACVEHSRVQHVPQFRNTGGGAGGPFVRLPSDRRRFVCRQCDSAVGPPEPEEFIAS